MVSLFNRSRFALSRCCAIGALTVTLVIAAASSAAAQSARQCDAYARDIANRNTNTAGNVIGGAAIGAIGGAIIGGAIRGGKGAGRGAAIGGGVGALGGAAHNQREWEDRYSYAYNDCMRRASAPRYQAAARPEPWSDEWYAYCSAKYRSFDPNSGTYQPYNGPRQLCR